MLLNLSYNSVLRINDSLVESICKTSYYEQGIELSTLQTLSHLILIIILEVGDIISEYSNLGEAKTKVT